MKNRQLHREKFARLSEHWYVRFAIGFSVTTVVLFVGFTFWGLLGHEVGEAAREAVVPALFVGSVGGVVSSFSKRSMTFFFGLIFGG